MTFRSLTFPASCFSRVLSTLKPAATITTSDAVLRLVPPVSKLTLSDSMEVTFADVITSTPLSLTRALSA